MPKKGTVLATPLDRFWSMVEKHGTGCWEWTGATHEFGYGVFGRAGGKGAGNHRAHRFSYRIHKGEIPDGMFVCHRCDNPRCVNPDHLFLGTAADNHADMRSKGRNVDPPYKPGSSNGNSKLQPDEVISIRKMAASGIEYVEIAECFGVSHFNVGKIVRRETWAHI